MVIDLAQLAWAIGIVSVIIGGFVKLYKPIKILLDRLTKLERWTRNQQKDIERARERNILVQSSVLTCLEKLSKDGHNGELTGLVNKLRELLLVQSNQGSSYMSDE